MKDKNIIITILQIINKKTTMLILEKDLPEGIDCFKLFDIFCNMAKTINKYYVYSLFTGDNRIVLYSIDNSTNDTENCPCGLIYKVEKNSDELTIYIMFIATQYKCRKTGYASIFINEFIDFIKKRYSSKKYTNITIVLDSLETAVTFYEYFGFKWVPNEKKYDSIFNIDETKKEYEHFIMVFKL